MTAILTGPVALSTSQGRHGRPVYVRQTAERALSAGQRIFAVATTSTVAVGLVLDTLLTLRLLIGALIAFNIVYLALRCLLVLMAGRHRFPARETVTTEQLPRYTTLHPMYDEAHMIPLVVAAMEALDYPKDRLQCLLVLEERDRATVEAARSYPLPDYFEIVETPTARPYGKPKACNHALQFATGEFVVIFDAEDRPEPRQLRTAVETFRAAEAVGAPVGCLQARLVFHNQEPVRGALGEVVRDRDGYDLRPSTWCTRFLGNEYATHFELVLPGLSHLGLPVPLGGTSNHFPLSVLRDVAFHPDVMPELPGHDRALGAWDPWNVTEDAELGGAIAAHGYTTGVIDSHTDEEAVLTPLAAVNQRSRWVKGYAQTSLVLLRRPVRNMVAMGPMAFAAFLLQVGGTYLSLLLAPVTWGLTLAFVATRSHRIIELFPGPMAYLGVMLFVGGNIALVSVSLASALRKNQFSTVRYLLLLTPLWWILLTTATWIATVELVLPRWRPSWNKTAHGVRYATRRRTGWLHLRSWLRARNARPTRPALPRQVQARPALAVALLAPPPLVAATAVRRGNEPSPRLSVGGRADAARRAAIAGRDTRWVGPAQQVAIADRRAAARTAKRSERRSARAARADLVATYPVRRERRPGPGDFGSGFTTS